MQTIRQAGSCIFNYTQCLKRGMPAGACALAYTWQ
jgi:hypothetical protein